MSASCHTYALSTAPSFSQEMDYQLTAQNTTTAPNPGNGTGHAVLPVGSHGGLHDLERLPEGSDLEQVQTGAEQQVAELDGLLLELSRDGDAG